MVIAAVNLPHPSQMLKMVEDEVLLNENNFINDIKYVAGSDVSGTPQTMLIFLLVTLISQVCV